MLYLNDTEKQAITMTETTEQPQTTRGSCLCGTVKYHATGEPVLRMICYCQNCQKFTGSVGMANSMYLKEVSLIIK